MDLSCGRNGHVENSSCRLFALTGPLRNDIERFESVSSDAFIPSNEVRRNRDGVRLTEYLFEDTTLSESSFVFRS